MISPEGLPKRLHTTVNRAQGLLYVKTCAHLPGYVFESVILWLFFPPFVHGGSSPVEVCCRWKEEQSLHLYGNRVLRNKHCCENNL